MLEDTSLARAVEAAERAQRQWRLRHEAQTAASDADATPPPPDITVTIGREAGTPATSVAHELGHRLGWLVYDHELLEKIAEEMGLRTQFLETIEEQHITWMREVVNEAVAAIAGVPALSEGAYVRHLLETVLSLGAHGECVIVGRGAEFILPAATTLRVRLTAPLETRIAAVRAARGISEREARRHIDSTDRARAAFVRDHFHGDTGCATSYDLVLNAARFSVSNCAEIISRAVGCFRAAVAQQVTVPFRHAELPVPGA